MSSRHLFVAVLEDGKSEIKALADSGSGESRFLVHRQLSYSEHLT